MEREKANFAIGIMRMRQGRAARPGKAGRLLEIDIEKFGEAKLIELNHRIVERLRYLRQVRTNEQSSVSNWANVW